MSVFILLAWQHYQNIIALHNLTNTGAGSALNQTVPIHIIAK